MSKVTDRMDELSGTLDTISALIDRTMVLRKSASNERAKLVAREHRRKARKRKWLWLTANFSKGPKYGTKLKVVKHNTKYCDVEYRGKAYYFRYNNLSLSEPNKGTVQTNRHLANFLGNL